ncbi:hypothetical protein AYL99_11179 [Fonsecaea erecta]|uniref:CBM21 domain-containing protein n=1 Tax=Fonsecaea erecta TaxID=1367422 RepID=A0A178Z5D5_9EURO|nr:hypothetical protein AYL99_11179 [Fonsecaea erecta]OAP54731.1 hypothetical protein AYL99_11179 [Fonsecaea erecta]
MPYTPPTHHTPSSSKQSSPTPSRSHSYIKGPSLSPESADRPNPPRSSGSSSYLTKHRRSPSLNDAAKIEVLHNGEAYEVNGAFDPHDSIRQSPPPVTNALIPAGMTISPPDSSHNSSDEDEPERGRSRDFDEDLQALQEAIRSIEQRKVTGSPTRGEDSSSAMRTDTVASRLDGTQSAGPAVLRLPLSQEARKISHSRSSTDSNIVFESPSKQTPSLALRPDTDDSDSDNPPAERPAMVRKKSGELVRPALRPSSRRRPSSMPGTPTYSKAVHFDSHLEHVRHFLQVDRPLAVSAGSSPVENYESETDFPFGSEESNARSRTPSYEWEIRLNNFPSDLEARRSLPVFVERIFLSSDNKNLIGTVAVQNLAFHKQVVARFTFDYWKTTSEIVADYNNDVRRKGNHDGLDRFNFSIKLEDQANLESKTLFFCIRYSVNGQEFWDNNAGANYQVDFSKKSKSPPTKSSPGLGERPLNALPRSRPSPPTSSGRPVSMPISFDDFSTGFDSFGSFLQSPSSLMGEPKLKLRSPKSKSELLPDAPQRRKQAGPQAFGNRYDFKTSLTAAKNNAYAAMGEWSGLGPRTNTKQSSHEVSATTPVQSVANAAPKHETGVNGVKVGANKTAPDAAASAAAPLTSKPAALLSEKPSLSSQSYKELVDKYCFFGTAKVEGSADSTSASESNGGSSADSSGSTTPTPPRSMSPVPDAQSSKPFAQYVARSSSPLSSGGFFGPRSGSPASFGYPYHSATQHTLMSESPTPTAIQG